MKANITLLLAALVAIASLAQTSPDTIKVINDPKRVVISELNDTATVNIIARDKGKYYGYEYKVYNDGMNSVKSSNRIHYSIPGCFNDTSASKHEIFMSDLRIGWGKAGIDLDGASVKRVDELGVLNFVGYGYKFTPRSRISIGVGANYRRYVLQKGLSFTRTDAGGVAVDAFPAEASHSSSHIGVWQITFPLMYRRQFANRTILKLGAVLNWNCHASIINSYKLGDTRHYDTTTPLMQRKLSVDFMAAYGWRGIGLYFNYSPMSLLKKNFGPDINHAWTAGLVIGL